MFNISYLLYCMIFLPCSPKLLHFLSRNVEEWPQTAVLSPKECERMARNKWEEQGVHGELLGMGGMGA